MSTEPPMESRTDDVTEMTPTKKKKKKKRDFVPKQDDLEEEKQQQLQQQEEEEEGEGVSISRIKVLRQKYIPVSKIELLNAIVLKMFQSPQDDGDGDTQQFLLLSLCLDAILHAEHKNILEEMRTDYSYARSIEKEETINEGSATSDTEVVADEEETGLLGMALMELGAWRDIRRKRSN